MVDGLHVLNYLGFLYMYLCTVFPDEKQGTTRKKPGSVTMAVPYRPFARHAFFDRRTSLNDERRDVLNTPRNSEVIPVHAATSRLHGSTPTPCVRYTHVIT